MSSNTNIRKMTAGDKQAVIEMMRVFYTSPAVFSNGSKYIFTGYRGVYGRKSVSGRIYICRTGFRRNTGLWHGGKKLFNGIWQAVCMD